MKEIIEALKMLDLYGKEVIFEMLKSHFKNVSFRLKSVPNGGSVSYKTSALQPEKSVQIEKYIIHRNNEITLKTSSGYLRFF